MEASSIYQSRIKTYTENLRAIRKEDWLYTVARVLIVLAMLVLLYLGINSRSWSFIGGSAALLPLFLFLLLRHRDVRHRAQKLKSYIRINRAELGYLEET
ncbi:MAG: hypothetical protein U5L96_10730 [Owenweeksia sp.]|nr:hypothetical protein [Owenweeksia sp.]